MDAFATLGPAEDRPLPPPPVAGGMTMQPAVPDPMSGASLFPPATAMPAPTAPEPPMPAMPAMPAAPQSGASLFPAAPPMPTSAPVPPVPPIPAAAAAGTGGAAPALLSPTGTAIFGAVAEPTAPQSNTPEFNNVQLWKDGFHQGMAPDTALPPGARAMPGMAAMPPATPAANPSPKLMVTPTPLKVANMLAAPLDLAQPPAPAPAPPQASPAADAFSSFAAPAPQIPAPAAFAAAPPPPRAPEVAPDAFPPRAPVAAVTGGAALFGAPPPTGAALFGAASPSDADSDAASAFGTPAKPVVLGGGGSPSPPPTSRSGSFSPRGAGKHFREFTPPPPAPEEAFGAPPPVSVGGSAAAAAAAAFSAPAAPADPFSAPPPVNQVPSDPFGAPAAPSNSFSAPAAPADPFSAPPPPVNQAPSDPFGAPAAPADPFSAPPPPVNQAPAWGFEARLREIFDRVDTSGDGDISVVEAVKALRKDDDFAKVLGFDKATRVRQEDGTRDQLILALGALDADGDKKVSWAEFRRVATCYIPFGAPAATDPFSAPSAPVGQPSDPFGAPQPPPRAPQPPQDAFAAPDVYHGGWGGQQPPPSNAFAATEPAFESPAPKAAAPRNTASPDLFGDSVAPSTVSSGEKKKAAKNFDFGLHSELVSLDLNANGAPPKAKSAIKQKPAVAMNKMATTERRSSMLSTQPMGAPPAMGMGAPQAMGMPQPMGIQAHPAFARYTAEQQQWLLAQTPQVQAQYLQ